MVTASRRRDADSSHTGCRSARRLEPVLDAVDNTAVVVESIDNANSGGALRRFWWEAQPVQVYAASTEPEPRFSFATRCACIGPYGHDKYLGIQFEQSSVDHILVDLLEQRFYDGFKLWYRRARTLRGRLLVAQTMVLSVVALHPARPHSGNIVKRWQSVLNKFVFSRKHDRHASHVQLIPTDFLYQRREDGGLGVPRLAAHLKRQHLQLLLQVTSAVTATHTRDWTTASSELLR